MRSSVGGGHLVANSMDRWEDADDDITPMEHSKGRVARMGIAGFVQAAGEPP